jgi:hypothetical protein
MTVLLALAIWCGAVLAAAALSRSRGGVGVALVLSAALLPVPAFLDGPPVLRFLLALVLVVCFLRLVDFWRDGAPGSFRGRVAHLGAGFDTRLAVPRPPGIELRRLGRLAVAGALFLAALASARAARSLAAWPGDAVRWLAGAVMTFTAFEAGVALLVIAAGLCGVTPPVMHAAPHRSRSLAEFWGARWNRVVGRILRARVFAPLAHRGASSALLATFVASAALHVYAAGVSLDAVAAASWGAFFLVQPPLLWMERRLRVRRWTDAAARAWTLFALALPGPLFVEPFVRLFVARA